MALEKDPLIEKEFGQSRSNYTLWWRRGLGYYPSPSYCEPIITNSIHFFQKIKIRCFFFRSILTLVGIHKLRKQECANFWPPSPLRKQIYYISLCSSISIWLPPPGPLPLACLRSLWMVPSIKHLYALGKYVPLGSKVRAGGSRQKVFPLLVGHPK